MNAFRIIAIAESREAADGFEAYINNLNLTDEIRAKITEFIPEHPLYQNGFHPALALHMIEYNKQFTDV